MMHLLDTDRMRPAVVSACWADRKAFSMHRDLLKVNWGPNQPDLAATPDGFGMHCAMHRVELLQTLGDDPFTVLPGKSEDISFCKRVRDAGGVLAMSV